MEPVDDAVWWKAEDAERIGLDSTQLATSRSTYGNNVKVITGKRSDVVDEDPAIREILESGGRPAEPASILSLSDLRFYPLGGYQEVSSRAGTDICS